MTVDKLLRFITNGVTTRRWLYWPPGPMTSQVFDSELCRTDIERILADQWDLIAHLERQRAFSEKTFGPGHRTGGVIDHIRKELVEIEQDPLDLKEWVDVIILGLDGAWRAGHSSTAIVQAIAAKQFENEGRTWPDWRTQSADKAITHTPECSCHETSDFVNPKCLVHGHRHLKDEDGNEFTVDDGGITIK